MTECKVKYILKYSFTRNRKSENRITEVEMNQETNQETLEDLKPIALELKRSRGFGIRVEDLLKFLRRVVRAGVEESGIGSSVFTVDRGDALEYQRVLWTKEGAIKFLDGLVRKGLEESVRQRIQPILLNTS